MGTWARPSARNPRGHQDTQALGGLELGGMGGPAPRSVSRCCSLGPPPSCLHLTLALTTLTGLAVQSLLPAPPATPPDLSCSAAVQITQVREPRAAAQSRLRGSLCPSRPPHPPNPPSPQAPSPAPGPGGSSLLQAPGTGGREPASVRAGNAGVAMATGEAAAQANDGGTFTSPASDF